MNCIHGYYSNIEGNNRDYLFCNITKDSCAYVKLCRKEDKIINIDGYRRCKTFMKEKNKIPDGDFPIRFCKKDRLYVDIGDTVITIPNIYGKKIPKSVKLVRKDDTYIIEGTQEDNEVKPKKEDKR